MTLRDAETGRIVGETFRSRATANRPFGCEWRDQVECRRVIIVTPGNDPRAQWYFATEETAKRELMAYDLERVEK